MNIKMSTSPQSDADQVSKRIDDAATHYDVMFFITDAPREVVIDGKKTGTYVLLLKRDAPLHTLASTCLRWESARPFAT